MVEGKPAVNFWRAMLYLSPAIILLAIFTFYPVFNTFMISFQENYNYMTGKFSGFGIKNYVDLIKGGVLKSSLANTLVIVFVSVPVSLILSLLIAVALNSIKGFKKILQTVFFLPYVTNTIAIGMVFAIMFESRQGLVNSFIKLCGGVGINWLGGNLDNKLLFNFVNNFDLGFITPQYLTGLVVLLIYIIWNSLPFKILILLSSLQSIDKQYYQAAKIDGASKFKTFMKVTVPFVSPQLVYLMITSFIGAWKEYSSIDAIFGDKGGTLGNPTNMATVVWYIYAYVGGTKATSTTMGRAAALAIILFIIILLFTALNRYISNKRVHY